MSLVCRQCSRVNPEIAYYCYYDGAALAGRAESDGPINLGAQPFPSPFVFPSGSNCRNFDQLAMACQQNWTEAASCLKDGFFGSFFGTIGRLDLARAAKEAAAFPDASRALDQLLGKLPTQTLERPKLRVEPTEINLGQLKVGQDGKIDLALENQGMRLVYGTITSDVPWLTLAGHSSKIFELTDELTVPVEVRGSGLRARLKGQEGRLVVESNAGNVIVTVKIEVPPIPFAEGMLQGALSPRQIAERARANPTGAVPLFESGKVKAWFTANGLIYPVQGPTVPGTAGVQQFFEALGLAKPPKVEFTPEPMTLEGHPGETIHRTLTVSTPDKKLVYAYATGDQPWIDGNSAKPAGRTCTIDLKVTVPQIPGETLGAKVTVHANGSQKFHFPITLTIKGRKLAPATASVNLAELEAALAATGANEAFEPVLDEPEEAQFTAVADETPATVATPAAAQTASTAQAITATAAAIKADAKPSRPMPAVAPRKELAEGDGDIEFAPPPPAMRFKREKSRIGLHAMPAALLLVVVMAVVVRDYFSASASANIDPRDRIAVKLDYSQKPDKTINNSLMFGLQDISIPGQPKSLIFSPLGQTNSVVLSIDGKNRVFGKKEHGKIVSARTYTDKSRVIEFQFADEGIEVKQTVQLIPGDPIEQPDGGFKRYIDTCLVKYKLTNYDKKSHDVGLRFLLDTYIGQNDKPLFMLPGRAGLVRSIVDLQGKEIPDYIQALEVPKLEDPGVIAQLNLRLPDRSEFPSRVSLTQLPEVPEDRYEFDVQVLFDGKPKRKGDPPPRRTNLIEDSAIAIYWKTEPLAPGRSREFGFTYGIGNVGGLAELTILNPGPIVQGTDFSLVALVAEARKGTQATISLQKGLELVDPATATLTLSPPDVKDGKIEPAPATWTIRAPHDGQYKITVTSGAFTTHRVVTVRKSNIF